MIPPKDLILIALAVMFCLSCVAVLSITMPMAFLFLLAVFGGLTLLVYFEV